MNRDEHNRVVARAVVMSLVGIATVYALFLVREVLLTLYVSAVLAIGLSPIVRRIERRRFTAKRMRVPRVLAILSIYVGFLLVVAAILSLVLPPLISQVRQLLQALPGYVDRGQNWLIDHGLLTTGWSWGDVFARIPASGLALSGLFGAVQSAIGTLGKIVTVLVLPFYLLLESASLRTGLLRFFKESNRRRADHIMQAVTIKVGAWLGGQFLLGAIIGTSSTIGFWLIGVPFFYVLGVVAAVGELIPVIGPILASVPAILLALTVSPQAAIITAIFCWAQQFVENNFLVPRIMERQVGVSPVAIIVALLVGSTLLGFIGAVLAVPSAAIVQVFIEERFRHDAEQSA